MTYKDLIDSGNDDILNEYAFMSSVDRRAIEEANDDILMHVGVGWDNNPPGVGSSRYPHGSGDNPYQHDISILGASADLKKKGLTEPERAAALGFKSTAELRAQISIAKNWKKKELSDLVPKFHERGMSNKAIAEKFGISETSVRNYLDADRKIQVDKTTRVADILKAEIDKKRYVDIGPGSELGIVDHGTAGVSQVRLQTAVEMLKAEGYHTHKIRVEQVGNPGNFTTIMVLGAPDTTWKEVNADKTLIKPLTTYILNDGVGGKLGLQRPKSIDSKRIFVNYTNPDGTGGAEKDGVVEIRRGVEDISLGNSRYAQVRIGVDGTHYMKGIAVYSDNIPEGYDIVYNTNKKVGASFDDVFKKMKTVKDGKKDKLDENGKPVIDWDNPFGAAIKPNEYDDQGRLTAGGQSEYIDANGNRQLRVINKVNEQGDWSKWSKTISAQVLAKQPQPLVKRQLELTYQDKKTEFDTICALDNPTIKKNLLESFADDCDASCVHLKAKAFPGQASHVIIPIPSLGGDHNYRKEHGVDGEIFAPNYEHGSTVALVRYPHAGTFEIPILRVNNHNKEAVNVIGKNSPDAVGINAYIAQRLSGADFDGDTVAVIPTTHTNIKSTPQLKELEGFDTKIYKFKDENAKGITSQGKQQEMGKVTNLIADMQIMGCSDPSELARAVKHSMVVIDSEKHHLDWKQSERENGIQALKDKYQGKEDPNKPGGGAHTLITRAGSEIYVNKRKVGSIEYDDPETGKHHKDYGVDKRTGEKVLVEIGETYTKKDPTKSDPNRTKTVFRQEKTDLMTEALRTPGMDARDLMSSKDNPHHVELLYADYANKLYALANEARRIQVNTPGLKYDPQAKKEYAKEVEELNVALTIALKNAPKERQAQIIADATYKNKKASNPDLDKEHLKRLRGQCLDAARKTVGAKKIPIDITDRQWEAIQKGAISNTKLEQILNNTDADKLKQRAMPRDNKALNDSRRALAISMANSGFTNEEIAKRLGVSSSTVSKIVNE